MQCFLHPEPDSRSEFSLPELSFLSSIRLSFKNFIIGHTHDQALAGFVIIPVLLLVLALIIIKREWGQRKTVFMAIWL